MELVVFDALEASVLSGVSVRVRPSPPIFLVSLKVRVRPWAPKFRAYGMSG